jgi:hypothetical protein
VRAAILISSIVLSLLTSSCGPPARTASPAAGATEASGPGASAPREPRGAPLEFVLDPLERDYEYTSASDALRGKRAVVVVLTTYDVGSLAVLRNVAPLLNDLPADAACLLVALQPLGDRPLIQSFLETEKTPCRRAIGDPNRGRLGDLAKIQVVPTVLVLRADGSLAGGIPGVPEGDAVRVLLEQAKR